MRLRIKQVKGFPPSQMLNEWQNQDWDLGFFPVQETVCSQALPLPQLLLSSLKINLMEPAQHQQREVESMHYFSFPHDET